MERIEERKVIMLMPLIIYYSNLLDFDATLLKSVISQESNFNVNATGRLGEIGLLQLRPEFLPGYTKKELYLPEVNIKLGIELLKDAKRKCIHKGEFEFLNCYNYGVAKGNKLLYPSNTQYVISVKQYYEEYKNERVFKSSICKK